jgi:hypothetical protein
MKDQELMWLAGLAGCCAVLIWMNGGFSPQQACSPVLKRADLTGLMCQKQADDPKEAERQ